MPTEIIDVAQKVNIIIGGDSWGVRPSGPEQFTHCGLEEFFLNHGHRVINTSENSSSNSQSIERLNKALMAPGKDDIIIWIQSDPMRDVSPDQIRDGVKKHGGFIKLMEWLLTESYSELNAVAARNSTIIYLIGGLTNILDFASNFKNLKVLVQSWNHLLVGHRPEYADWHQELFIGLMSKHISEFQLESYDSATKYAMTDELHKIMSKWQKFQDLTDIYPDGAHPSKQGHEILFNYIKQQLGI
jgi:hypothetical protein